MTANLSAGDVPPPCCAWLQATGLIGFKCVQRSASDVLVDYYQVLLRNKQNEV